MALYAYFFRVNAGASWTGRPDHPRETLRFIQAQGRYTDDYFLPGLVYMGVLRSPYAHADVRAIEVDGARRTPSVLAVVTGQDLVGRFGPLPLNVPEDGHLARIPHPVLAAGRVRYTGEPVAAVVAESREAAVDAAALVEVDYDPLPAVTNLENALHGDILLHEELGDNVLLRWHRTHGDVEGTMRAADRVVRERFHIPRVVAAPIEPRGAVAAYDPGTDLLTVWCSAQDPQRLLAQLSQILGRSEDRIRVVVPDVGEAFGSTGSVSMEGALAAHLAMELRRPVKWIETRRENFMAGCQGPGMDADVELAVDRRGRIRALRAQLVADLGAYLYPTTGSVPVNAATLLTGGYTIPEADVELLGVATNKVPTSSYRGAGRTEACYIIERMVDLVGREIDIDPVEVRRRNLIPPDRFPYRTPLGFVYDAGDYAGALTRALQVLGYDSKREEQRRARAEGRLVGIGIAMPVSSSGAYGAVVEILRDSGEVSIRNMVAIDEARGIVNPLLAENQVLGGIVQGLGETLVEEAVYDGRGQLVTGTFADYGIPRAMNTPPVVSEFMETPSPFNPLGAKGIGEAGAIATPPALANAVMDAFAPLGVRHVDLPLTPEKIWCVLRDHKPDLDIVPGSGPVPPIPRYADLTLFDLEDCGRRLLDSETVAQEHAYWLEVAIRTRRTGIGYQQEPMPAVLPVSIEEVMLYVVLNASPQDFDIPDPVATITLPAQGDSSRSARFRVIPKRASASANDLLHLEVRIYYELNLVEYLVLEIEARNRFRKEVSSAFGNRAPLCIAQQSINRSLDRLRTGLVPREMHIHVTTTGSGRFHLMIIADPGGDAPDHYPVMLHAPLTIATKDLRRKLQLTRTVWYQIAIGRHGGLIKEDPTSLEESLRELARRGADLWSLLFRQQQDSAVWKIGTWLKAHRPVRGALIQVTISQDARDFVFPWSLLYDGKPPRGNRDCVDPEGFWGLRYCIEQQIENMQEVTDQPIAVKEPGLKLAFMLWEQFPNAESHVAMIKQLCNESSGKLQGGLPPINAPADFFKLIENCDSDILYFYTHGYAWSDEVQAGRDGMQLFIKDYEALPESSPAKQELRFQYELLREAAGKNEQDSWIGLSHGRVFFEELRNDEDFRLIAQPVVFLNMCQSAQIMPSLADSFVALFLGRGARSVVGTECPMTVDFAHPFAERILRELLRGRMIGQALLAVRKEFLSERHNPLGLAYSLYGSATTQYTPPPLPELTPPHGAGPGAT